MYCLKFTLKGPEYTRNIYFFIILLQIFSNIKKLRDCFFALNNSRELRIIVISSVSEICLWLEFIESCEETGEAFDEAFDF